MLPALMASAAISLPAYICTQPTNILSHRQNYFCNVYTEELQQQTQQSNALPPGFLITDLSVNGNRLRGRLQNNTGAPLKFIRVEVGYLNEAGRRTGEYLIDCNPQTVDPGQLCEINWTFYTGTPTYLTIQGVSSTVIENFDPAN